MVKRKCFEIKAQAAAGAAEVWIYEEIGNGFWGDGLTAKRFAQELAALGDVRRIDLRLNSPGGNVFDGQAIYNVLKTHPATITSYVDGLAASIATVIALAGDRVIMRPNALWMVHQPYATAMGTADVMRDTAAFLDKVGETVIGIYEARSALTREEIVGAMSAETWYTAEEALEAGYVDELSDDGLEVAAGAFDFAALGFKHPPTSLLVPAGANDQPAPAGDAAPRLSAEALHLLTKTRHGGR